MLINKRFGLAANLGTEIPVVQGSSGDLLQKHLLVIRGIEHPKKAQVATDIVIIQHLDTQSQYWGCNVVDILDQHI